MNCPSHRLQICKFVASFSALMFLSFLPIHFLCQDGVCCAMEENHRAVDQACFQTISASQSYWSPLRGNNIGRLSWIGFTGEAWAKRRQAIRRECLEKEHKGNLCLSLMGPLESASRRESKNIFAFCPKEIPLLWGTSLPHFNFHHTSCVQTSAQARFAKLAWKSLRDREHRMWK